MTPEIKAAQLVNKFKSNVYKKAFADTDFMYDRYYGLDDEMAKQCALIAVDEILQSGPTKIVWEDDNTEIPIMDEEWWESVKQEIEAL